MLVFGMTILHAAFWQISIVFFGSTPASKSAEGFLACRIFVNANSRIPNFCAAKINVLEGKICLPPIDCTALQPDFIVPWALEAQVLGLQATHSTPYLIQHVVTNGSLALQPQSLQVTTNNLDKFLTGGAETAPCFHETNDKSASKTPTFW